MCQSKRAWHRAKKLDELYYTINAMEMATASSSKTLKRLAGLEPELQTTDEPSQTSPRTL
jgi:hypothetical protein